MFKGLVITAVIGGVLLAIIMALLEPVPPSKQNEKLEIKEKWGANSPSAPYHDKDKLVLKIQRHLNSLGINTGPADGIYGPKTRAAILKFQKKHKLPTDGNVSESLVKHLDEALHSKSGLKAKKPPSFQNVPEEFRGIKWGEKRGDIAGMSFFEKGQMVAFSRRMNDELKLNTLELSDVLYGFTEDKFSDIFFIIAPKVDRIKERGEAADAFESLKKFLFQKHGIPTREHSCNPLKGERIDTYKWISLKVNASLSFDLLSKVTLLKYWYIPLHKKEVSFPSWELYTKGRTFNKDLRFQPP